MKYNKSVLSFSVICALASAQPLVASETPVYGGFPVTVQGYSGDASTSVSYKGQIARHLLHNSLKKQAAMGDGNAKELEMKMLAIYTGEGESDLSIGSPEGFKYKQSSIDELSKGKDLKGKTYKGTIVGWPGNMTGPELVEFMIGKAAASEKGFDPLTGYDYQQLISKFVMGAVFYNQAVDNYLDEKLAADTKPNDKPYKDGAAYTGKEHVWDEAFGYFGVPAHVLSLSAGDAYTIAKAKADVFAKADANGDGVVDLYTEMTYAHGYYAANADKGGKSDYLHTITKAFIDGRQLITNAKGKALSDDERKQLVDYANTISSNWELVIAEAAFKYAGSVYKDLQALEQAVDENLDAAKVFRQYAKHWGELKGFTLALQTGKNNLGETATKLNRLIGFSPVLLGNTQVEGIDSEGNYKQAPSEDLKEYRLHMLKVQKVLDEKFSLKARNNDMLAKMGDLLDSLGGSGTETD